MRQITAVEDLGQHLVALPRHGGGELLRVERQSTVLLESITS